MSAHPESEVEEAVEVEGTTSEPSIRSVRSEEVEGDSFAASSGSDQR